MKRLTLAEQVALVLAIALFVAQGITLALAVHNRHAQMLDRAIVPGAQMLADTALGIERGAPTPAREFGRGRFARPRIADRLDLPPGAEPLPMAQRVLVESFAENDARASDFRAYAYERASRGGEPRRQMLMAARLEDGRWILLNRRHPPGARTIFWPLFLNALIIYVAVIIPTLLILRRVGGSLLRLTEAASRFDGSAAPAPLTPQGPRDVRRLVEATNAMQARIAAMMNEKDVMLGAIGHDLRTPLTALRIEAETVGNEEKCAALVGQIEALHEQFEHLLEFARAGRAGAERSPVEVAALLQELLHGYDNQPVTLGRVEPASVLANRPSLARAIANLVDNALRYAGTAELRFSRDGDEVTIAVLDEGPGIPEGRREEAMAPFGRLEQSRNRASGGHGLGLAIVNAVARAQGGRLELASREGAGLAARIILPRLS